MEKLSNKSPLLIVFITLFVTACCQVTIDTTTNLASSTEKVKGEGEPCNNLVGCMKLGVMSGLAEIEQSEVFPLFGKRLILEKLDTTLGVNHEKNTSKDVSMFKRAARLLDTHSVRLPITSTFSLKLYRTARGAGPFDLALEISSPDTRNGRTFFRKRLQMALLPIMYKLGVMTTLMGALVIMVMKSLVIGILLLILGVSGAIKHKLAWQGNHHHQQPWGYPSGPSFHSAPQDIHVHLHGISAKDAILHKEESVGYVSHHGAYSSPQATYVSSQGAYSSPQATYASAPTSRGDLYLSPYNKAAHNIA